MKPLFKVSLNPIEKEVLLQLQQFFNGEELEKYRIKKMQLLLIRGLKKI